MSWDPRQHDPLDIQYETDYVGYGYAVIITAGGVLFGWVKVGDASPLLTGLLFGAVAFVGAYQTSHEPKNTRIMALGSGILTVLMAHRIFSTLKIFPASLIMLLSAFMFGRSMYRLNCRGRPRI